MENLENQNIGQDSYKTGSTKPPEKRGGLIAVLLVAVILLAGAVSILSGMNIRLFRMLQEEKGSPVTFAPGDTRATMPAAEDVGQPGLGMTVGSIGELERRFYELPAGALVTRVDATGCAAQAGVAVGDIIVAFNGSPISTAEELEKAMEKCQAGQQVQIEFYRHRAGKKFAVSVTLDAKD